MAKGSPQKTIKVELKPGESANTTNRAPLVADKSVTTRLGKEVYIQLSFEDSDGPGPYTYTVVRGPAHGTLLGENNDRTYKPRSGYAGNDEFVWKVNDGKGDSQPAKVSIRVVAEPR